ncbi:restriction endonuclease subunit S [Bacillus cihuensis]|uniref:restriction endonuclease subunit S n=1 Tax=Bacillus cihuensis TaxID=1208599 RepID=UPI000426B2A4|nr:restriction endonuclease subunit S [Bacillus cihuensis]
MIELSFPTRKLGDDIIRINKKLKDFEGELNTTVFGVTKNEGITITGIKASDDLSKYIVLKGNQFAYNPYRINIGSIGLTGNEQEGLVSPAYIVFETKGTLLTEFLLHYLKSDIGMNLIRWYGNRGGVRDALRFDDLCKIDIPDLSVQEQEIALKTIKTFSEQVKLLNNELDKQQQLVEAYRDSILQDAIQGKLVQQDESDEPASVLLEKIQIVKDRLIKEKKIKKEKPLPQITDEEKPFDLLKGWEWVRFSSIMKSIRYGTSKKCDYKKNGTPVLRIPNISSSIITHDDLKYAILDDRELNELKLFKDDLLVIRSNGSTSLVGRSAIIREKEEGFCFAGYLIRVRIFTQYIDTNYINLILNSNFVRRQIELPIRTTTGVKNINTTEIGKLYFPIPPLNEQKRIVQKINELMELCDELEANIEQSKQEAEKLMKAVLQEAFAIKEEVLN